MKYIPKSSLFKKYVLSYILVFSLPLLLLIVVVNSVYISSIREDLKSTNESYLEQSNIALNELMADVRSLGNYVNQASSFSQFASNNRNRLEGHRETIKQYEHSTNSIEAMYVVITETDFVLSSRGNMDTTAMFEHAIHFSNLIDREQMESVVRNGEESLSIIENQMYYTMPLGNNGYNYGSILFVINTLPIKNHLDLLNERNEGMSFLVNGQNQVVLSSSIFPDISQDILTDSVPEIIESDTVRIDGSKYLSNSVTNEVTGWSFVSLIENNHFYRPLYVIMFLFVVGVILLTSLGIFISYHFAKVNYQPIKKLVNAFEDSTDQNGNEWDLIQSNINRTYSEIKILNTRMDEQAPIIRNATLLNLIEGGYGSIDNFEKQLTKQDIIFPFSYFALMIIELNNQSFNVNDIKSIEILSEELNTLLDHNQYNFEATIPHLRNNQIFLIVNLKENSMETWKKAICKIQKHIEQSNIVNHSQIQIGIGSTYNTWDKIKNSYIEASSALEVLYNRKEDEENVLFFKDIKEERNATNASGNFDYPEEGSMLLQQSLKQGNIEIATETINDIFTGIKNTTHNPIVVQAVNAYIVNVVVRTGNSLGLSRYSKVLNDLTDFSNTLTIEKHVIDICSHICSDINKQLEKESTEIGKKIVQYIFNSYSSPEISLEQIASDYNISISYASKLIKEETEDSFSNIVQSLRMNRFKELLVSTSMPIKELVIQVGYYDVSNFTRKFRKENELTPGQYRKQYKNTAVSSTTH
ncbi:AraC family transcriptional regulator [Marinilactibacillus sp. XAAS-LB27]|uniref:helix-turn-helix domain-containing protein n=1 Tax=Marinilactibacillus sp. XAAS-LB27 TaxID=3114538 RepID=UPI002E19DBEC|nr:AraC family transcriptional regulator [Marinilactibacillus sp. XAAS-LB27]